MSEVKVIGTWFSPYVKRVEMALKLKGVDYELIEEEDLNNKSPFLLQHNPIHKKVPVLIHNGKTICESMVILEYIDDVWDGPPVLPKDPYDRAMARFWAKFIEEKLGMALWKACWSAGEEREKAVEEATEGMKILEEEIKGKKFFGGDNVGLVDIVANFIAFWFLILQELTGLGILTKDKFPNLSKWVDDYCNESLVKENLPDKERTIAGFKRAFATGSLY